ncbi:hypothetical protein APHAL10511_006930 [Amanita phalloides]|nr:hypothetical protein APHAL10511_006930 [Amanita phalloides]
MNQEGNEDKESRSVDEREDAKVAKKKKKKKSQSHRVYPPLPLSARRNAGHVVFRGTERVDVQMDEVDEVGDGVFAV